MCDTLKILTKGELLKYNDVDPNQKSSVIWPNLGWYEQTNYGCDENCNIAARWANFIRRVESGEWRQGETEKPVDLLEV